MTETPWTELGVSRDAGDEEVRAAYLRLVKANPPDRAPEAFERIRDAYDAMRDPRRRAARVLAANPGAPIATLAEGLPATRAFVGPEPWLAVLEEG